MSRAWFDGVTITVEAALSAATGTSGAWDAGLWDTATWGPDIVWQDITPYALAIDTSRKMSRDLQAWEAGTATITLKNIDGRFSPSNLSGPYVTAGVTGVRPWRPVRVRVTYQGITYDLYRGYALDWLESWPGGGVGIVTVPCVDEWGRLAKFDGTPVTPVGAGESAGRRIHRILDNAGHTGTRSVDVGNTTVQATDLSKNAGDELKLVTDSEGGGLFVDADGTVVFERNYALMENSRSNTPQAVFVDAANRALGLPYFDTAKSYGGDVLVNIAAFARVGGTVQTAADNTSRALYEDLRYSRSDLVCETDAQVQALATFYVVTHKDPEDRIAAIVVKPRNLSAALYPQVFGRRIRDLIRVIRTPKTSSYTLDQMCHISGVSHTITKNDWTTTFDLWSASVYQLYATSRWDVGAWDSAAWFF